MYVYMYVCAIMQVYTTYVCVYISRCVRIMQRVCTYICMYIHIFLSLCTYVFTCIHDFVDEETTKAVSANRSVF